MVSIIPVHGIPEVQPGDDVGLLIVAALGQSSLAVEPGDVLVVTQKIVSKAEGRFVDPALVTPSEEALAYARLSGRSPAEVEVALREAQRVVRMTPHTLIVETRHGFVCANAGVDNSNVGKGKMLLLPVDPDCSAAGIRQTVSARMGVDVAVIISDTFGRPWRLGQTNVAIGLAGMSAFNDYRGQADDFGREMHVTLIAVADELAAAAELVQNKVDRVPVALIRGYRYMPGDGKATDLNRPAETDLFR